MKPNILLAASFAALSLLLPQKMWLLFLLIWAVLVFRGVRSRNFSSRGGFTFRALIVLCILPILYMKFLPLGQKFVPIGLSFFAFQAISFLVDARKGKVPREASLRDFLLYMFYAPKFFVGPIERFSEFHFKTSVVASRTPGFWRGVLYLLTAGLFKSLVLAPEAQNVMSRALTDAPPDGAAATLTIAHIAAVQLYSQFSGYIDIARAVSRLAGVELTRNFLFPYLSINLQDFWQRWHISFTSWLRDYLFYPLFDKTRSIYLAIFATIFLTGIWHGPAINFIYEGIYCATVIIFLSAAQPFLSAMKIHLKRLPERACRAASCLITLQFTSFGLLLMLVPNREALAGTLRSLTNFSLDPSLPQLLLRLIFCAAPLLLLEKPLWRKNGDESALNWPDLAGTIAISSYLTFLIHFFGPEKTASYVEFLYFQF